MMTNGKSESTEMNGIHQKIYQKIMNKEKSNKELKYNKEKSKQMEAPSEYSICEIWRGLQTEFCR